MIPDSNFIAQIYENDKFVALELLKNANIASNFVLPGCQDTGTAIVAGKRGQYVLTDGDDEAQLLFFRPPRDRELG